MESAVTAVVSMSVHPSVCYALLLYQNDASLDHILFTN